MNQHQNLIKITQPNYFVDTTEVTYIKPTNLVPEAINPTTKGKMRIFYLLFNNPVIFYPAFMYCTHRLLFQRKAPPSISQLQKPPFNEQPWEMSSSLH